METNARLKEKKNTHTHTQSNKPQKPNEQLLNEKKINKYFDQYKML